MNLYHYTKFEVLKQIVKPDDIKLRASRYSNYDNGDCKWVENVSNDIIRDMTEIEDLSDRLTMRPFIICFCKNGRSESMWKNYADGSRGIQLVFDGKEIEKVASRCNDKCHDNPDDMMDCIYTSDDIDDVRKYLRQLYKDYRNKTINDKVGDLLTCQCFLKQKKFKDEKEMRYLIPEHDTTHFHLDKNNVVVSEDKENYGDDRESNKYSNKHYVLKTFPHAALKGIQFGDNVTKEEIKNAIAYLESECGFSVERLNASSYKLKK